ncbi:galactose-binding domain-like protein [Blastocladiella britannica]|nr:galactose-binding domain-like protein [Blastocladiella britannica]
MISSPNNLALSSKVVFVSSQDARYPPLNAIDGNPKTFWTTTGMFPQEMIIQLAEPAEPQRLVVYAAKLKKLEVHAASIEQMEGIGNDGTDVFESITTIDLPEQNSTASIPLRLSRPVSHIKLVFAEGHSDFVAVRSIALE